MASHLTIPQANVRGLRKNFQEINLLINDEKIDVALLSETMTSPNFLVTFPNHECYRIDGRNSKHSSMVLVRKTIRHRLERSCQKWDTRHRGTSEIITVVVSTNGKELAISSLYNSPLMDLDPNLLHTALTKFKYSFLAGDLNAKTVEWDFARSNHTGNTLLDFMERYGISMLNDGTPTFYSARDSKPEILDLHLANKAMVRIFSSYRICDDIGSDHLPAISVFNVNPDKIPTLHSPRHDFSRADWQKFREVIDNELQSCTFDPDQLEPAVDQLNAAIATAVDLAIPTTKLDRRQIPPQALTEIKLRRSKRAMVNRITRRIADGLGTCEDEQRRLNLKSEINRHRLKIKRLINEYNLINTTKKLRNLENRDNPKTFWRSISEFMGNKKDPAPHDFNLLYKGTTGRNETERAEIFASYLQDVMQPPSNPNFCQRSQQFVNSNLNNPPEDPKYKEVPHIPLEPITLDEIQTAVENSKEGAPGEDKITKRLVQNLSPTAILLLLHIFNACLTKGAFPTQWKSAIVTTIHKFGKPWNHPKYHRPISLTSYTGKLFEKIILSRLLPTLDRHDIVGRCQTAYRPNRSTTDQTLRLTNDIHLARGRGDTVSAVFLDAEKAFDQAWTEGLIFKIRQLRMFPVQYRDLLVSYITNRTIRVRQGNTLSRAFSPAAGVPQGGVLSPVLYCLYTSEISNILEARECQNLQLSHYADDLGLWTIGKSAHKNFIQLQKALKILTSTANRWRIGINPDKSQAIHFDNSRSMETYARHCKLTVNQLPIPLTEEATFLGLIFDRKLTWKSHIQKITKECNARINQLYRLSICTNMSATQLLSVYLTLIRPVMLYGSNSFLSAATSSLNKLQILQNKALKCCTRTPRYAPNSQIHNETVTPPIKDFIINLNKLIVRRALLRGNSCLSAVFRANINAASSSPVAVLRDPPRSLMPPFEL